MQCTWCIIISVPPIFVTINFQSPASIYFSVVKTENC